MSGRVQGRSPTAEDHARWADAIRMFVSERLGSGAVTDVFLRNDLDSDGDDIVRVAVIFRDEPARHVRQLAGLTGFLRSEMGDFDHFPIVSFISKADADEMKIEAA